MTIRKYGSLVLLFWYVTCVTSAKTHSGTKLSASERCFKASRIYSLTELYFSGWQSVPELDLDIGLIR